MTLTWFLFFKGWKTVPKLRRWRFASEMDEERKKEDEDGVADSLEPCQRHSKLSIFQI